MVSFLLQNYYEIEIFRKVSYQNSFLNLLKERIKLNTSENL